MKKASDPKKPQFVIRLDERGYYGSKPWSPLPLEQAIRFDKKTARARLSWLQSRNIGYDKAEIEPAPKGD